MTEKLGDYLVRHKMGTISAAEVERAYADDGLAGVAAVVEDWDRDFIDEVLAEVEGWRCEVGEDCGK